MFTLNKDISQLYQWDSNVKLIVEDERINQVQFSQRFSQTAVCVEVKEGECLIPNEFLQSYSGIEVNNDLASLVGIYVEIVNS